ncbi:hypothetical protein M1B79_15475 [Bacteroides sp. KH365_2]|uniref:Uncharacterized protein n=1 Tax=Bacteroides muris (ex Fokt et al. 2023) TaxID=2937417 RepID=A0A9X2NTL3_9BACE|nr:hypothetical protein [Bacteroides muris (ex Fokt et al. 2023)]
MIAKIHFDALSFVSISHKLLLSKKDTKEKSFLHNGNIVPPWRKNRSTMVERFFPHDGTI